MKTNLNKLSTRLTVLIGGLVLMVTVILTVFSCVRAKLALERMLETHGKMLLSTMDAHVGQHLVLAYGYNYDYLRNYVSQLVSKEALVSYAAVANTEGILVAHSDNTFEGRKLAPSGGGGQEGPGGIFERKIKYRGSSVLELISPVVINGKKWGTIQLGINHGGVDEALQKLALSTGLAGVLVLCASILGARALSYKVTSGLTRLVDTTRNISEGDFKTHVDEEGFDEFRALARSFNVMAENLRSMIAKIQEISITVGDFSSNIVNVVQEQAAGAAQQAASVSEVTATMEELNRTSHQIAINAEEVRNSAATSVEMARQGTVLIRESVGGMEQIKQRVGDIARRNLFLGEKSQEIGKVMEIIKEIASEIHLLALNAAIESAAAGEHGRRFSVVASEVRRLAEKTRESTETIRSIISEIQAATGSSIQATEQGAREVDRWRETVNLSAATFEEIIQKIEKTLEASTQISLATHQQTSANEQVVQAMRQAADMVRETATGMRNSSASAGDLKEMAAKLREHTLTFRV